MADWLPSDLKSIRRSWMFPLPNAGVGGVSATDDFTLVSSRDSKDQSDYFACLDTATGVKLWDFTYRAAGQLDYGNSPRATPLIDDPYIYTLGAFGDLHCLDIDSGEVVWKSHLVKELGGELPTWGYAGTPLRFANLLIVQPGGKQKSLVALDASTGEVVWSSPGTLPGYSSPIAVTIGNKSQIVTYDKTTLGGWNAENGERLWTYKPKHPNDFNVPTPIVDGNRLIITTENNGARVLELNGEGIPGKDPLATNEDLRHDSHSPVQVGSILVGCYQGLYGLDLKGDLKTLWSIQDEVALDGYTSLIASDDRVLALSSKGELLLYRITSEKATLLDRYTTEKDSGEILAHPALIRKRLMIRSYQSLVAWDLSS